MRVEWKLVVLCWGVQHLGAQSTLQGGAFCFYLFFLRLNPSFSPQFLTPGGSLDQQRGGGCSKSITMGDSETGWTAGLRVHRLRWERGRGDWLVLVFIPAACDSPCSEPLGSENLSSSSGSITPGLCCVPRALHCRDQGIFHLEVGKTTLAAFLSSRLAEGAESGTYFHLTHLLLRL